MYAFWMSFDRTACFDKYFSCRGCDTNTGLYEMWGSHFGSPLQFSSSSRCTWPFSLETQSSTLSFSSDWITPSLLIFLIRSNQFTLSLQKLNSPTVSFDIQYSNRSNLSLSLWLQTQTLDCALFSKKLTVSRAETLPETDSGQSVGHTTKYIPHLVLNFWLGYLKIHLRHWIFYFFTYFVSKGLRYPTSISLRYKLTLQTLTLVRTRLLKLAASRLQ